MTTLAKARDVLARLDDDLDKLGYVGTDKSAPRLVFLALYTRWFQKPVSIILLGPHSSGKSDAAEKPLKLIPEEAWQEITTMTPRALAYVGEEDYKNKFLYAGEYDGVDKKHGLVLLRQMLSRGKITPQYVTQEKGKGRITVTRTIQGPMGLLMTTNHKSLDPQDESRAICIRFPEQAENNREVLLRQAKDSELATGERRVDTKPWFDLHRMVARGSKKVTIPFSEELADVLGSSKEHRVKRDYLKILALIKAHALLHQKTRKSNSSGIHATYDDYEAVRKLLEPFLVEIKATRISPNQREIVETVRKLANGSGVSQSQVAKEMGKKQGEVTRDAKKLIMIGLLNNLAAQQRGGKKSELVLGDVALPDKGDTVKAGKILPTIQELRG